MKSLAKKVLGFAVILVHANSAAAGAYVAVSCGNTHVFDLNPSQDTFRASIVKDNGDRLESVEGVVSKRIESLDAELAIFSFKDRQSQWPTLKINQVSGETSTTQLRKIKVVNKRIDTISASREVDLVIEIGTQESGSYQTLKYIGCKMHGGRVDSLEPDSWFKAFTRPAP